MTLREFYTGVKEKTEDMSFSSMWEIKDLSSLCYYLSLVQLPEELLDEVGFIKNKKEFDEVFENFDPRKILRHGQYLSQLNYVLDYFVPEKITPYKKLTQTVFQTVKMLSKYRSVDEFINEVTKECPEKDDKKTFEFLNSFRLKYALPSMFFNTTCYFFSKTGILDIPYLNQGIKNTLFKELVVDEDNYACFHLLSLIIKISNDCGYEVSQRIEAYKGQTC